jgi:prepilin-type N-terminal cleavage/methylation domain-containing protein
MKGDTQKGFTLVELIVAVGLFTVVMFISTGALLSIVNLNKKAQAQQSVINNLSSTMESMVRNIRTGTSYHCLVGATYKEGDNYLATGNVNPTDCPAAAPGNLLAFKSDDTTNAVLPNPVVVYTIDPNTNTVIRCREQPAGTCIFVAISAPEIKIDFLSFDVQGTDPTDKIQASARINLSGYAFVGVDGASGDPRRVNFALQTRATQRNLDI